MKPLWRWTLGPVHPLGVRMLLYAIRSIRAIYGDVFDYVVCHNNIDDETLTLLRRSGVELFDQNAVTGESNLGEAWKLVPPRLRPDSYEIVCDNDLIFFRRSPTLERWLTANATLLLRGRGRYYGQYEHLVPAGVCINSGIYGMPPGFDFTSPLARLERARLQQNRNGGQFDDQGLVTLALLGHGNTLVFEPSEVFNYDLRNAATVPLGASAIHLIDGNRAHHPGWKQCLRHFAPLF